MRAFHVVVALAVITFGCSRTPDTVKVHSPPPRTQAAVSKAGPAPVQEDARSPFVATWEQEAVTKQGIQLVARIERRAFFQVPLAVELEVPKGIEVTGARAFTIPPATGPDVFEQRYVVQASGATSQSLVLVVAGAAEGFGYHARVPWTFGREPAPVPQPAGDGPNIKAGAHDFGRAVPMTPRPPTPR